MNSLGRGVLRWPNSPSAWLLNPVAFGGLGLALAVLLERRNILMLAVILPLGLVVLRWSWRHPVRALIALAVGILFQELVLAWLYRRGVPTSILTTASYWKEAVLLVAAARTWVDRARRPERADALDLLVLAVLGLVAIYLLLPLGPELRVRYVAGRADVAFLVLFLIARWSAVTERDRHLAERAILTGIAVVAALGIWNYVEPDGWTRWVDGVGLRGIGWRSSRRRLTNRCSRRSSVAGRSHGSGRSTSTRPAWRICCS